MARRNALSAALAEVARLEGIADLCPSCGGLTPDSSAVLVLRVGEEPPECAGCGLWLTPQGVPVGHRGLDGVVTVRLIALRDDYPADAAPLPPELQEPEQAG